MLAVVAGALGRYLARRGELADDLTLRAMVPVSMRADLERGALGNRVAAMWASLPVVDAGSRRAAAHDQP